MELPFIPDLQFHFHRRPSTVPGEQRIAWRISLLVLVLFSSRSKRSSLARLHLVCDGIRTKVRMLQFQQVLAGELFATSWIPRIDPSLGRAIDMAIGEDFVERVSDRYQLKSAGIKLGNQLTKDETVLKEEKEFLKKHRPLLTEGRLSALLLRGDEDAP